MAFPLTFVEIVPSWFLSNMSNAALKAAKKEWGRLQSTQRELGADKGGGAYAEGERDGEDSAGEQGAPVRADLLLLEQLALGPH